MFKTYDETPAAYQEHGGLYYDLQLQAWVDVPSAKTYDDTETAWIERLRASYELTVTDGFYANTGNLAQLQGNNFNVEIKFINSDIRMEAILEEEFINPVFYCEFTFGNSDFMTGSAPTYRSHHYIYWWLYGYKDGKQTLTQSIVQGGNYSQKTIYNSPRTLNLTGEFDKLVIRCNASTPYDYTTVGRAITSLNNITIDGIAYRGNATFNS